MSNTPTAAVTVIQPVTPPAMIGILGGGQLSRYFVMAARSMGYRTTVLEPDPDAPAGAVADVHLIAAYDDPDALAQLGATCAVVTTELEHAPTSALQHLAAHTTVHPSPAAVATCQDRITEREFLTGIGVQVAPWRPIVTDEQVDSAADFGFPGILKVSRPDGGATTQIACWDHDELHEAWHRLGKVPCVLEQRLELDRELSIVLARNALGSVGCYPVAEDRYVHGVLDLSLVPAKLPDDGHRDAARLATYIAEKLNFVGVLAVEMFVVGANVFVNELTPRPHSSGYFTLDACTTSQFEQQVRAVCTLGLGDTALTAKGAATVNLLGELWAQGEPHWERALAHPSAHLHLYGAQEPRPGRTMGHLTLTLGTADGAAVLAAKAREQLVADYTRTDG